MKKIKVVLEALLSFTMGINISPMEIYAEEAEIPKDNIVYTEHIHDEHCNHEQDYGLILWNDHIHLNESSDDTVSEEEVEPEATELPSLDMETDTVIEPSAELTVDEEKPETEELPEETEDQSNEEDVIISEAESTESSEPMATCSHTYTYTYKVAGHTQHTKTSTCTKCGATSSVKENHNWSGDKCVNCGCYKPFTSNGTYDVIAESGVQLYSENNSGSTKVKTVSKGTAITVTNVAVTSSGYYWGKVTKIGTAAQSGTAYVCMKSSELKAHSHSYTDSYSAAGHTQHTKTSTCTKCGATSSVKENHTWSGDKCSKCGVYKPFTSDGVYDVIASSGVQLYSENNSGSSKVTTVSKDTAITVTNVAVTSSGYYWGKVTKIGTAAQSGTAYVCMKSSELKAHSHSYTDSYSAAGHTQHTKTSTCTKCGATSSVKENHTWSGDKCSKCGVYKPFTSDGVYDVIASSGVQLYSENNSGSSKVTTVSKDTAITVTNVAVTSSGYYWGKVTKIGTAAQSATAYVCMKSSELKAHSHSNTESYSAAGHTQHTKTTTCSKCGAGSSTKENHIWSGDVCSKCGVYKPFTSDGVYDVTASAGVILYLSNSSGSRKIKTVPKGTAITVTNVAVTSSGYYWGKVTKIGTAAQSTVYVCMKSSELKVHSHNHEFSYNTKNNILHTIKLTCSACGQTSTETEPHNFVNGVCTKCSAWEPYKTAGGYLVVNEKGISTYPGNVEEDGKELRSLPKGTYVEVKNVALNDNDNYYGKVTRIDNETITQTMYIYMGSGQVNPHTHTLNNSYTTKNNLVHYAEKKCTACKYSEKLEESHTFVNGVCTKCSAWEPYKTAGGYLVVNEKGISAYPGNVEERGKELRSLPKGTYVEVKEVALNDNDNYYGKVTRIDNETITKTMYIYMGSGQVNPHTHTLNNSYSTKNNLVHYAEKKCTACKYSEKLEESHNFVNGVCTKCSAWEPYKTAGGYLVVNEKGISAYPGNVEERGKELRSLPKGTYVEVKEVALNDNDNYYGKVTRIDNETITKTMYIYMGSGQVNPHTHTLNNSYSTKNNLVHYAEKKCTACKYSEKLEESHNFVNGVCTKCSAWEPYKTAGGYLAVNEKGISAYPGNVEERGKELRSLPKGTYVEVKEVALNNNGNYYGKVTRIDNETITQTMYIYMGSGQVNPHTHTFNEYTHSTKNNLVHRSEGKCTGCSFIDKREENHDFVNGVCTKCSAWEPYKTAGGYLIVNEKGISAYPGNAEERGKELRSLPKGTYVEVKEVALNDNDNYYGKVTRINNETITKTMYIYMGSGQVNPHTHTFNEYTHSTKNNLVHRSEGKCTGCSFIDKREENHDFVNGVCTKCSAWEPYKTAGGYLVVNEKGISAYPRNAEEHGKELRTLPKGTYVEVKNVALNANDNYYGKVTRIDNETITQTMYIYMGSGQVNPHNHSDPDIVWDKTTVWKDDDVHLYTRKCPKCKYLIESEIKHNPDDVTGICSGCKKEVPVSKSKGNYVPMTAVKLYKDTSLSKEAGITVAENELIVVSAVKKNDKGYTYGKVSRYAGKTVKNLYVKMSSLKPHTIHDDASEYVTFGYEKHDTHHVYYKKCTIKGCSYITRYRGEAHSQYFENGVCTKCNAKQVAFTTGYYRVSNQDIDVRTGYGNSKKGTIVDSAKVDSTILITSVEIGDDYNYWGKVGAYNGMAVAPNTARYVKMNELAEKVSPTGQIVSVDKSYHYYLIYEELVPQKHTGQDYCSICNTTGSMRTNPIYFSKGEVQVYKRTKTRNIYKFILNSDKVYPAGSTIILKNIAIDTVGNKYYGQVASCDGKNEKAGNYVLFDNLIYHPEHEKDSVKYINYSDTKHRKQVNCPTCDLKQELFESHVYNGGTTCIYCGAKKPLLTKADPDEYYQAVKYIQLYEKLNGNKLLNDVIPSGTVIAFRTIKTNKSGNYRGEVKLITPFSVKNQNGFIDLEDGSLILHEHSMNKPAVAQTRDYDHVLTSTCTLCNYKETITAGHSPGSNGKCTVCGAEQHIYTAGDYLAKADGINIYKTLKNKTNNKVLKTLKKGDFVYIKSVQKYFGYYYGKISSVNDQETIAYVAMSDLQKHKHTFNSSIVSVRDEYHELRETCTSCSHIVSNHVPHNQNTCAVCGQKSVSHTPGLYKANQNLDVYDKAGAEKAKKKNVIKTDNKLFITEVKAVNGYYWGKLSEKRSGYYWIRMTGLTPVELIYDYSNLRYQYSDLTEHTVFVTCDGMTVSYKEKHQYDTNGKCVCGFLNAAPGTYFTRHSDVEVYSAIPSNEVVLKEYVYKIIPKAGTKVTLNAKSLEKIVLNGVQYCKAASDNAYGSFWIRIDDLTDHIHIGSGDYIEVDDKYHNFVEYPESTVCTDCNEQLPDKRVKITKEEHIFKNGTCTKCGMAEVYSQAGKYYAPYTGFHSYEKADEFSDIATSYIQGDIIVIEGDPVYSYGLLWGKVKNTSEYVKMKELLRENPGKDNAEQRELTNQELIEWCQKTNGANPLNTYQYYSIELQKLGSSDLLLAAVNTRSTGAADLAVKTVKSILGLTTAREYYKNQIVAILKNAEENAEPEVPNEEEIKTIKSVLKDVGDGKQLVTLYQIYELNINKKTISKDDIDQIYKLFKYCSKLKKLLELADGGLNIAAYIATDFLYMHDLIEGVREMQCYSLDDPDLLHAFDDVIEEYENEWYKSAGGIINRVIKDYLGDLAEFAWDNTIVEHIDKKLFETFSKTFGDSKMAKSVLDHKYASAGKLYSFVSFALDKFMNVSGGEDRAEAILSLFSQIAVRQTAMDAYEAAVSNVASGNNVDDAVVSVRKQFELYKASTIELYNQILEIENNHLFGINEDAMLKNYLQFEINKLEKIRLVNDYELFINAISFDEYKNKY